MVLYGTLWYGTARSVLGLTQCTVLPTVGCIVLYYLLYVYYIVLYCAKCRAVSSVLYYTICTMFSVILCLYCVCAMQFSLPALAPSTVSMSWISFNGMWFPMTLLCITSCYSLSWIPQKSPLIRILTRYSTLSVKPIFFLSTSWYECDVLLWSRTRTMHHVMLAVSSLLKDTVRLAYWNFICLYSQYNTIDALVWNRIQDTWSSDAGVMAV